MRRGSGSRRAWPPRWPGTATTPTGGRPSSTGPTVSTAENGPVAGLRVVVLGGTGYLGRRIGEAFRADRALVHLVSRSPAEDGPADARHIPMNLLAVRTREL